MGLDYEENSTNTTNIGTGTFSNQNELAPLYSTAEDKSSLKCILVIFSTITAIVSVVLFFQIQYYDYQIIPHGSVGSDNEHCSMIGADVIKSGGNAVDAAVATTLCMAVINPHITGIGGGGLMLIYDHRQGKVLNSIDFRVQKGIHKSVGVPGFLAGLALAHEMYGSQPWEDLIQPAIHLAKQGFPVSRSLMDSKGHVLPNGPHNFALKSWLSSLVEGEFITNLDLANTLELVKSREGIPEFYNHTLSSHLTDWIPSKYITAYTPQTNSGMRSVFKGYNIIVSGQGSGGPYLLNSLPHLEATTISTVASLSMAFSENHIDAWPVVSGSHVSVVDNNDLFVSTVTGLGSVLGSQFLTRGGYILNNALENIQSQDVPNIEDGQFIPTLLSPIVVTQDGAVCGRRFVFGCGDIRDGLQTLLNLIKNSNETFTSEESLHETSNPSGLKHLSSEEKLIIDTIESPRVRIIGPHVAQEQWHNIKLSPKEILTLKSYNFNLNISAPLPYPSFNIIEKISNNIYAYSDSRGYGRSVVF